MNRGLIIAIFFVFLGCGVKGDPLPPERPPELGRGRPTYKRAAERIQVRPQQKLGNETEDEVEEEDRQAVEDEK